MHFRCICNCHHYVGEEMYRADGVDTADPLDAACACSACQDFHVRALSDVRGPRVMVLTPGERAKAWAQFVAEQKQRPPSWRDRGFMGEDDGC